MQLYFIRHAQSANNALYERTGSWVGRHEDPPLTDLGRQQARLLGEYLRLENPRGGYDFERRGQPGFGITHLYTSLMERAMETGSILAAALDLPLQAWVDLHEEGGIFQEAEDSRESQGLPGRKRADFERDFPHMILPPDLGDAGWWNRPRESPAETLARARNFLTELRQKHQSPQDRVAVVSHGGFYNFFMAALLGYDKEGTWLSMNNAALSRIDFNEWGINLAYSNLVEYLPKELVT